MTEGSEAKRSVVSIYVARRGDEGHRPGDPAPEVWYDHNGASIPDGDPNDEFDEWPVCSDCGGSVDGQPPGAKHV